MTLPQISTDYPASKQFSQVSTTDPIFSFQILPVSWQNLLETEGGELTGTRFLSKEGLEISSAVVNKPCCLWRQVRELREMEKAQESSFSFYLPTLSPSMPGVS